MAKRFKTPTVPLQQSDWTALPNLHFAGLYLLVVALSDGYAMLPFGISKAQAGSLSGLGKTKIQEKINQGELAVSKVDGRTIVHTSSVIALMQSTRLERPG